MTRSLFLLVGLCIAACASAGGDPKRLDAEAYLPMEEGRSWTFEVRSDSAPFRLRHVRIGGDRRDLKPYGSIRYDFTYGTVEGEEHDVAKSIYARTPGAPSLYYFDAFVWSSWFDPPLPLLPADATIGTSWTWTGNVEFDELQATGASARLRIEAEEEVAVPAGTFRAIRIEQIHEEPAVRVTRWLAPGVGLVREEQVLDDPERGTRRRSVELTAFSVP